MPDKVKEKSWYKGFIIHESYILKNNEATLNNNACENNLVLKSIFDSCSVYNGTKKSIQYWNK